MSTCSARVSGVNVQGSRDIKQAYKGVCLLTLVDGKRPTKSAAGLKLELDPARLDA